MDSILNKLTEIEKTASAIVEHAEAQKEVLDKEYDGNRICCRQHCAACRS